MHPPISGASGQSGFDNTYIYSAGGHCAVGAQTLRLLMLISPHNVRTLAELLVVAGFDSSPLLRCCGFSSIAEVDAAPWLPLEVLDKAMRSVVETGGDPGYGLVAAESVAWMRLGVIPMLALYAPTLRHILADIERYIPLLIEHNDVKLVEHGEIAEFSFKPVGLSDVGRRFRAETLLLNLVKILRCMGAAEIVLAEFNYPRPDYGHRYAAAFGSEVMFDRQHCALHFKAAALDVAVPGRDPSMYIMLKTRAEAALAAARTPHDLVPRLRDLVLAQLPQRLTMSEAAAALMVSERSLRRHLGTAGVSYSVMLRDSQRALAEQLLARGDHSVKQIAGALGFSSASCFHRAFRRWLGATPREWQLKGAPQPT